MMRTYDDWKTTDPAEMTRDDKTPPCERSYPFPNQHLHPRFPSGFCVECGAEAHEGCKVRADYPEYEYGDRDEQAP